MTAIKKITVFMLLYLLIFNVVAFGDSTLIPSEIESFLDAQIQSQMTTHNIPNLTISVVYEDRVVFSKGYGYQDHALKTPVDPEKTLFRIGSSAKLFTWTSIMQLVEEGRLDLDADIHDYLDFKISNPFDTPITMRHLMNHTPGFEDYMSDVFSIDPQDQQTLEEHIKSNTPKIVFEPGEVRAYSNYGASLAGYIVQQISGMPFSDYVAQYIYAPLGMNHSTFTQPVPAHLRDYMSVPYRSVDGELLKAEFEIVSEPAGSMSSSALDMAKFMTAYLNDSGLLLSPATIEYMFEGEDTPHPLIDGMAHGFIKGNFNGHSTFYHPGGTMLYDTGLFLIPDENLGFFISHSGGNFFVNMTIFRAFLKEFYETPERPITPSKIVSEEGTAQYTGRYYQNRRSFTTSDALLSLLIGTLQIESDENGDLMVTHLGETDRFMEIEPGVFYTLREGRNQDYGGNFKTLLFKEGANGQMLMFSDGPMSYSKAKWYETGVFTLAALLSSILLILGSLIFWSIKGLIKKIKKSRVSEPKLARYAKLVAISLSVLVLVFLMFFLLEGELSPVYGLPVQAFTTPSPLSVVMDAVIAYLILFTSIITCIFAVISWKQKFWKRSGRVHFTIFALSSGILSWIFYYWNIL